MQLLRSCIGSTVTAALVPTVLAPVEGGKVPLRTPVSCLMLLDMPAKLAICRSYHVLTPLQIKLGASLFIPNSQIGTFGAVTQFKSLVKNNTDMFDVSFAGPLAAATTSLLLFAVGLAWSSGADIPKVRHHACRGLLPQHLAACFLLPVFC